MNYRFDTDEDAQPARLRHGLKLPSSPTGWPKRPQTDLLHKIDVVFARESFHVALARWGENGTPDPSGGKGGSQLLDPYYTIADKEKVGKFLKRHAFLVSGLLEARAKIEEYFEGAEVSLNVVEDPEGSTEPHLAAYVWASLSPSEAFVRLTKMDEEWWLDVADQLRDKLSINVRFR